MDFVERLESTTAEELFERKVNYHDKCYSSFANVNKLDRARKRFAESINIGVSSVVKRKKGRPSFTGETTDNDNKLSRTKSKTEKYDKTMCIICQKPDGHTCKVAFKETAKTLLSVAQKLSDKTFFIRLNTILMLIYLRNFLCLSGHQEKRIGSFICTVCTNCAHIFLPLI